MSVSRHSFNACHAGVPVLGVLLGQRPLYKFHVPNVLDFLPCSPAVKNFVHSLCNNGLFLPLEWESLASQGMLYEGGECALMQK